MDKAEWLIDAFTARSTSPLASKLDALIELERLGDTRVVAFWLHVLTDEREPVEVRIHVLRRLRDGRLIPGCRLPVAEAIRQVAADHSSPGLRLTAALALAEFADIACVVATLGGLALDPDELIDLRYSAFTSLQRAGPTAECVALVRQLATDETLGGCARSLLSLWRLD
jgi:predicted neuraminidase